MINRFTAENQIKTADIFLSAFLLNNEIILVDVEVEERLKRKIVFCFPKKERTEILLEQFNRGIAETNVVMFKQNFRHIQDLLHEFRRKHCIN